MAGILHLLFMRKQAKASAFIDQQLWDKREWVLFKRREQFQALGLMLVVAMMIVALARPQWGERDDVLKREGLDIMVAVDVSKSMLTRDVSPTRLGRTQLAIKDLVKKLKGDRIGLMAFAGEAFVMCPLTLDYQGFLMSADDLSPDVIPKPGTNLSKAIDEMLRLEGKAANHYQVLVLITDGEELDGDALKAARKAKDKGIKIFTVGVGTKQGDLIEVTDAQGNRDFLKDSAGQVIKSSLNENLLQQIAYETGGAYVRSSPVEFGLDFLYDKQLVLIPKREMESKSSAQFIDRYQVFIALSLFGLGLMLLPERLLRRLFVLLILCVSLSSGNAQASVNEAVNKANEMYRQGDFDNAQQIYQDAYLKSKEDDRIAYNLANSLYKKSNYDKAAQLYEKLKLTKQADVALPATYNLGNTRYRQSEEQQKLGSLDKAINAVSDAIKNYEDFLKQQPHDNDALSNLDKAKQKLEELKRQQEQQQQKQQNQEKNQQQNQQHNQQQDQNAQQNSENQQNSQNQQSKESQQEKEQQNKDEQENQGSKQEKSDKKEQQSKAGKDIHRQETPEQKHANDMLEDYQRQEEPKGMLYLIDKHSSDGTVTKDW